MRHRSGVAKAVPAWRTMTRNRPERMACRRRRLRRRMDRGLRPAAGRRGARADRAALCRCAVRAGAARDRRRRHADRPAGARRRRRPRGRECAYGRCSAPGSRRCSRCRRGAAIYARDYREACRVAQATSEPPRKVSKQLFNIAPKIREVDEALRAKPGCAPHGCSRCIRNWRSGG